MTRARKPSGSLESHFERLLEIEGRSRLITLAVVQLLNSISLLQMKDDYRIVVCQKIKIPTLLTSQTPITSDIQNAE